MNSQKSYIKMSVFYLLLFFGMILSNKAWAQQEKLEWKPFEGAIAIAEEQQKPMLVYVWAPWCGWCKKMEKEVYPKIESTLNEHFILTSLNRDDNESRKVYREYNFTPLQLAKKLNVQEVPAVVILSSDGEYLFHLSGYTSPNRLKEILDHLLADNL